MKKFKCCKDCISYKGVCKFCRDGDCYSDPIKDKPEKSRLMNTMKVLFEDDENDPW